MSSFLASDSVSTFVIALGVWAPILVFLITIAENIPFLGMFVPGDVVVILAAAAASQRGFSYLLWVLAASTLGAFIGNNITYFFFRKYGSAPLFSLVRRFRKTPLGKRTGVTTTSLYQAENFFEKHGSKTILIARFATGIKAYIIAFAGAFKMPVPLFEIYTLISSLLYAIVICVVGWFIGGNLDTALSFIAKLGYVGLGIVVLVVLLVVFLSKRAVAARRAKKNSIQLDHIGYSSQIFDEVSSTNSEAKNYATKMGARESHKTIVVARKQTGGQGRLGRVWSSPEGGAYFSVVLGLEVDENLIPTLSLVAGLAVCRALEEFAFPVQLKWPNDVVVGDKKLAGILVEKTTVTVEESCLIIGIGINVRRGEGAHERAYYISDGFATENEKHRLTKEKMPTPQQVITVVAEQFTVLYSHWVRDGFGDQLLSDYEEYNGLVGNEITVSTRTGTVLGSGHVIGVDQQGNLVLDNDNEIQTISSGEVTLRPAE